MRFWQEEPETRANEEFWRKRDGDVPLEDIPRRGRSYLDGGGEELWCFWNVDLPPPPYLRKIESRVSEHNPAVFVASLDIYIYIHILILICPKKREVWEL